jgi:hypothetical protein
VTIAKSGGSSFNQPLAIHVTDVNEAILDIGLSKASVNENAPAVTLVGFLSTQDPDANSTFSYSLVEGVLGCDGADNGSFTILGNALRTNTVFDYETGASYSICIRSTDNGNLSIEKHFTSSSWINDAK